MEEREHKMEGWKRERTKTQQWKRGAAGRDLMVRTMTSTKAIGFRGCSRPVQIPDEK